MSFSNKSQSDLEELISYGASVEISASNRSPDQLNSLAAYAKSSGVQLVITGASGLGTQVLQEIAAYGKGHVMLKD